MPVDLRRHPRALRPARHRRHRGRRLRRRLDRMPGGPSAPHAEIAAWSFHPRKIVTTGEGGMLTTSRADWAERARRLREHAMSVSAADRHAQRAAARRGVPRGRLQLPDDRPPGGCRHRAARPARRGDRAPPRARGALPGGARRRPGLTLRRRPRPRARATSSRSGCEVPRSPTRSAATSCWRTWPRQDISARRGIMAAHRQPAYADHAHGPLAVTERLTDDTLILPALPPDDGASSRTGSSTR